MAESNLLRYKTRKTPRIGLVVPDTNLNAIQLSNFGRLLTGLMELGEIPDSDLREVYELLTDPQWDRAADDPPSEEPNQG